MKLLIISDTHGDTRSLCRAVQEERDADAMIFLGDGLRDIDEMEEEIPQLKMKIYTVRGNCDYASFAPADGLAAFGGLLIYYTHGHLYGVKSGLSELTQAASQRGADLVLFGHTHIPHCETCEVSPLVRALAPDAPRSLTLFNPGSLSSVYGRGTYGVITIRDGKAECETKQL